MAPKVQGGPPPQLTHEPTHVDSSRGADPVKPADVKTKAETTSKPDQPQARKASPAEVSSKKGDAQFDGRAKQAELENKFEKTKESNHAKGVKKGTELDAAEKKILTETLLNASDKDLREIIVNLPKRDPSSQRLLLDVLNSSDKLMKRVGSIIDFDDKNPGLFEFMEKKSAELKKLMEQLP